MNRNDYIVEPASKAEEKCLRMGKRSLRRSNSTLAWIITFVAASAALAGSLCFSLRHEAEGLTRFLAWGLAWTWTMVWFVNALLWHERRTWYRMVGRLVQKPVEEDLSEESSKQRPRWRRWLARCAMGVAGLAVVLVAAWFAYGLAARAKLKAVEASIERDGIPLTWDAYRSRLPDLERGLAAESSLLVALDRLAVLPKLSDEEKKALPVEGYAQRPALDEPLPPHMAAALESRLAAASAGLEAVRQAVAERPVWLRAARCRPVSENADPEAAGRQIAPLVGLRAVARLLKMSAILEADKGNAQKSMDACRDGLLLAEVPRGGSVVIDQLVGIACEGLAVSSLEAVLAKTDPSLERLDEIDAILGAHAAMRTELTGELVATRDVYEYVGRNWRDRRCRTALTASAGWGQFFAHLPFPRAWLRMNEAYNLQLLRQNMGIWALPWPDFLPRYGAYAAAVPRWHVVVGTWPAVKDRELRIRGDLACARLGIAIKKRCLAGGGLPDDLASLKPRFIAEIPTEPFFGRPLDYTNTGGKAVIGFPCPDSDYAVSFTVFDRRARGPGEGDEAGEPKRE